jgi:type I restriction enzyme, R subunit
MIKDDPLGVDADITGIKLVGVVAIPSAPVSITLTGDGTLKPLIDVGSQSISARERARIEEIIRRINELFDGSLTDDQKKLFTFGIVNTLAGDKDVLLQAKANDQGTFAEGDFKDKVLDAIATQVEGQKDMGRQILAKDKLSVYVKLLAELAHERLRERADELGIKTA